MDFSDGQIERYSRHLLLNEIGGEGQKRLFHSSVLVIGAGGLGSAFLYYIVGSGIGRVGIVESDRVDLSNLQRQILYSTGDIGTRKSLAAKNRLSGFNPDVDIRLYDIRLDEQTSGDIFNDYDLIVDCTDNFESRFLINRLAIRFRKPLISGAVVRFEGNVMLIIPYETFCYDCVFDDTESVGQQITCVNSGVLSSAVGTIATIMATESMKFLLGLETIKDHLLQYNARSQTITKTFIRRDPYCKTCSKDYL